MNALSELLAKVDAFPRISKEYAQKTNTGALSKLAPFFVHLLLVVHFLFRLFLRVIFKPVYNMYFTCSLSLSFIISHCYLCTADDLPLLLRALVLLQSGKLLLLLQMHVFLIRLYLYVLCYLFYYCFVPIWCVQETVDHLFVNTTLSSHALKIDFDFSFPEVACGLLSVDVLDELGTPQHDAVHNIYKNKLGGGPAVKMELGNTLTSEKQLEELTQKRGDASKVVPKPDCGPCYGAGSPGECCDTCAQVQAAYERVGWRFKPQGIAQCETELFSKNLRDQFAEDGGCRVFGQLEPSQTSGHFHLAPHKKLHSGGDNNPGAFNLLELISFAFDQFNITHTVNSLSFGDQYPGRHRYIFC